MSDPRISILLAEDDPAHAEAIHRAFEQAGGPVELRMVESLKAFGAAVAERAPTVAVMDLNLSDGRAEDVLAAVSGQSAFPVVVMTSFGNQDIAAAAIKAGALDYLVKSSEAFGELPVRIDRVMREWAIRQDARRAHAALAEAGKTWQQTFDALADVVWLIDDEQRIVRANAATERVFGRSSADVIGRKCYEVAHGLDVPLHTCPFPRAKQTGVRESVDLETRGGHLQIDVDPIFDGAGRVSGAVHVVRDVSAQKGSEVELKAREARYRAAVETSLDGFWMTDFEGRLLEVNEAYVRLSGYSRDELLGMRVSDLEANEDASDVAAHMARLRETGTDIFETRHRRKDGTIWFAEVDTAVWPIDGGRCFVFIRDITRRRRSEYLLRLRAQVTTEAGTRSVDELLQWALDQMELLTGSSIGFFHFVEPDQQHLRLQTWSTNTLTNMCTAEGKGQHYKISDAGVWVDCVRAGTPVIHNDYAGLPHRKGMPEGHAAVVRELVVPVMSGGKVLAICGVGNKTTEYDQDDVEAVEAVASMVTDVALRKQKEEEFEHFFNVVPDLVCIANDRGYFHRLNNQWEQVLGYSPRELMEQPFVSYVHPDDRAATTALFEREMHEGQAVSGFVNRYLAKDGSWHWIEWNATPMTGDTRRIYAAARDITARVLAEEALRRSKQWMDLHLQNTPLAVIEWDANLKVCEWNPAAEEIFGYARAEAIGQDVLAFVPDSAKDAVARVSRDLLSQRGGSRSTNQNVTKDGRLITCDWFNTPLVDADGHTMGIASLVLDVTARHHLEAQLRQTQRMEAVGQLAGGVAHDFNNILAAMMMHLGLLKERRGLAPDVHQTVIEVHKLAERSAALTRQLLMFSRRSVLTIQTIDLNRVVTDLMKMLKRLIGEHVSFEFSAEPHLPSLQADSGMIEQVVTNLCVNARDAMPKGGRLTVWTTAVDIDPERAAQHPDARVGRFVCLSVRDTGTGMTEEVQQRIFEPFFTTKEAGKGTGLGLATVFGIVKQHNGWIEVQSQLGVGSTFQVFLPADAAEAELAAAAVKPKAQGGTETILVVEDDESVRRTVTLVLRKFGYRVLQAQNGPEALEVWAEHGDQVALLYTDMVMPGGMTGLDVARQFQARRPELKVIISSGYSGDLVGAAALDGTDLVFVPKPVASDDLVRTVRNTLDGKPRG